ncbi:hypothetical protein HDU87_002177 [Geranomyces variabilis]|uniref:ZN622/Rei1/Reh1 zinc finger C2H2-type domain-containing protein n=1 Tax=Geranomyces variabilis TaxID=109894 RepID=A0AAD5TLP6_9FUNG|nr:hypothetical protein HDU87_002177 [Geranomyces variabilis]
MTTELSTSPTSAYVSQPSGRQARELLLQKLAATKLAGHIDASAVLPALTHTCDLCSVTFPATKHIHHLQSKQHRTNVANDGAKATKERKAKAAAVEEVAPEHSWESENDCLFCLHSSLDIESNIAHMKTAHSFLIPDISYLAAPIDLLIYLAAIIDHGDCLWCRSPEARAAKESSFFDASNSSPESGDASLRPRFGSARAARAHMLAKGHCKVFWMTGAEIAVDGIYDYGEVDDGSGVDGSGSMPRIVGGELVLPSGARLTSRVALPSAAATSTSTSITTSTSSANALIYRGGRVIPARLATTLLSMKPSERNAILRASQREINQMAHYSAQALRHVAKMHDLAFKAKVKEWRFRLQIAESRNGWRWGMVGVKT